MTPSAPTPGGADKEPTERPWVPPPQPSRHPVQRALYLVLAGVFLCLAVAGAILPGVPMTVFVLLASWAAARGSPRLYAWLHRHRVFGPVLRDWHDGRRVSRRSKWIATLSMIVCGVILAYTVPQRWAVWAGCLCMAGVAAWLWRRPEQPVAGHGTAIGPDR